MESLQEEKGVRRLATIKDVDRILSDFTLDLMRLIDVEPVQLSLPIDGRGPRVKVSVRPGSAAQVPSCVDISFDHERVRVNLEVAEDYADYKAL